MSDAEQVIREYHESRNELLEAEARLTLKIGPMLPVDVRKAHVLLDVDPELRRRYENAVIAMDTLAAENTARMIEAQEGMNPTSWLDAPEPSSTPKIGKPESLASRA